MSRSIMEQRPPDHLLAQDRRDLERWQWEGGAVPEAHPSQQAPQARRERVATQPRPRTDTDETGEQPGDVAWRVGGPQGSGIDMAATFFSRAGAMAGLEVFGHREYFSNIQGRHSYLYEWGLPHTTAGLLEDTHRRGVQTLPSPSARLPSA